MPSRNAISKAEIYQINKVVDYYKNLNQDPPYDGVFQQEFEKSFSNLMSGGYSKAVSTGTIACFIGVRSLRLPHKSEIIISPVCDSGSLFAITESGHIPVVVDSKEDSYNTNWEQIKKGITKKTKAIFLVHSVGNPTEAKEIYTEAKKLNIKIIEDCSQAPFAIASAAPKKYVGSYSDIAVFSTMYRKSLQSGGSGGIVYTSNYNYYKNILEESDRGRPKWSKYYNSRNPGQAKVAALNYNTDEISCSIGISSLGRIFKTIKSRYSFLNKLRAKLKKLNKYIELDEFSVSSSPFLIPVKLNPKYFNKKNKIYFAKLVMAEGIDLSPEYDCIISEWAITKKMKIKVISNKNALKFKNKSFNLFLNENYKNREVEDIVKAFDKVLKFFIQK